MSFLKISDPAKRDAIVKEYLDQKKNIRDNLLSERVGEMETQSELSKFFKPITETQKATTKEITEGLKPIKEGIEKIPKAITFPAFPSIEAYDKPIEGKDTQFIGDVAEKALRKYTTGDEADRKYGIYDKNGVFYIGNKQVVIKGNDIIVEGKEYKGTSGLWGLIVDKDPVKNIKYDREDYDNYAKLMIRTNALNADYDPNKKVKSNKGDKWKKLHSDIWKNRSKYERKGIVVIPSDPNALLERLDLLLASQEAGHTGVGNELVSICDELKRQEVINADTYKKLNSYIKI